MSCETGLHRPSPLFSHLRVAGGWWALRQAAVRKSHSRPVPAVSGDYLQSCFQTRSQGPERVSNLPEATQLGGGSAWPAEVYIAPNPLAHLAT